MPRGENAAFKREQQRPLPIPLKKNALDWYMSAHYPDLSIEDMDLDAYLDSELRFNECLDEFLDAIAAGSGGWDDVGPEDVRDGEEYAEYLARKHRPG